MVEKNICPCCGQYEHDTPPGDYDICPICWWEDDWQQRENPDLSGGANEMSLNQAKEAYAKGEPVE